MRKLRTVVHRFVCRIAVPTLRYTGHQPSPPQRPSAVDVEAFTLNPDVVELDRAANARWNELSRKLDECRRLADSDALRDALTTAFALLEEVGDDRSPTQARVRLQMEQAQLELTDGTLDAALRQSQDALRVLEVAQGPQRDATLLAEAQELVAFVHLRKGDQLKAEQLFRQLLDWVDHGCNREPPMVRVASKNMRRTVIMGLGESLLLKARSEDASKTPVIREALDALIDALSAHVDADDFVSGKRTLIAALECFQLVGDTAQAIATCQRIDRWCTRQGDAEGVSFARKKIQELESVKKH